MCFLEGMDNTTAVQCSFCKEAEEGKPRRHLPAGGTSFYIELPFFSDGSPPSHNEASDVFYRNGVEDKKRETCLVWKPLLATDRIELNRFCITVLPGVRQLTGMHASYILHSMLETWNSSESMNLLCLIFWCMLNFEESLLDMCCSLKLQVAWRIVCNLAIFEGRARQWSHRTLTMIIM